MRAPPTVRKPAPEALAVEEEQADADEEGQQGQAEGLAAEEAPEARAHRDLVGQQIGAAHGHGEADEERAYPSRCAARTLQVTLRGGSIAAAHAGYRGGGGSSCPSPSSPFYSSLSSSHLPRRRPKPRRAISSASRTTSRTSTSCSRVSSRTTPSTERFRARARVLEEDLVYLKVKMRRHQTTGDAATTGVGKDEVDRARRDAADLRQDIERAFGATAAALVLPAGTEFAVRLEQALSSKTARVEDAFEATVYEPVMSGSALALPAGTTLRGIVRSVAPAERPSKAGRLDLDLYALYLGDTKLEVRGRVVDDRAPSREGGEHREEGWASAASWAACSGPC